MELSNGDIGFLERMAKRIEVLCSEYPNTTNCKVLNAYRVIKGKDLKSLKGRIEKWRNTFRLMKRSEKI